MSNSDGSVETKTTFAELVNPNAHVRVQGKDVDEMIESNPCHKVYFTLENCIADHDRDWRKCQKEVKALRECSKAFQKNTIE